MPVKIPYGYSPLIRHYASPWRTVSDGDTKFNHTDNSTLINMNIYSNNNENRKINSILYYFDYNLGNLI